MPFDCPIDRVLAELEMPSGGSNEGRSPSNDFGSCTEGKCTKRTTTQGTTSGMWFGPRLGKRRKSDEKQQINSEIEMLVNALDQPGVHWTVITIPGESRNSSSKRNRPNSHWTYYFAIVINNRVILILFLEIPKISLFDKIKNNNWIHSIHFANKEITWY